MSEFHRTRTGLHFFEVQVPALARALGGIAKALSAKPEQVVVQVLSENVAETCRQRFSLGWTIVEMEPVVATRGEERLDEVVLIFEREAGADEHP